MDTMSLRYVGLSIMVIVIFVIEELYRKYKRRKKLETAQ